MSTIPIPQQSLSQPWFTQERRHKLRLYTSIIVLTLLILGVFVYGLNYYFQSTHERFVNAKHTELRPSGSIGLKMGVFGVILFLNLYLYPLRKKWRWLQRFGRTKHWLDFHVLLGITAPLVITLHASFKFGGLAGIAYWMMVIVMLSGFAGRYIYAQIPRNMNLSNLSLNEMQDLCESTRKEIEALKLFTPEEMATLTQSASREEIDKMSLAGALWSMAKIDLQRSIKIAGVRRRLLKHTSARAAVEHAIALVRTESWLITKMAFYSRINQVFGLWHVVHRPFSYAFAVLSVVHISVVLLLGFF